MAVGLKIINGDFVINNSGLLEVVDQNDKCIRDFGKMLVTEREYTGNTTKYYRYNPKYGTELNNKNQFRGMSRLAIRDTAILLLNSAINDYLRKQETRDNLDLGEIIRYVNFEVFYDVGDLRKLIIEIFFGTAYSNEAIFLGEYEQSVS